MKRNSALALAGVVIGGLAYVLLDPFSGPGSASRSDDRSNDRSEGRSEGRSEARSGAPRASSTATSARSGAPRSLPRLGPAASGDGARGSAPASRAQERAPPDPAESALVGLDLTSATSTELAELALPAGMTGVVVAAVDPASPAAEAQLQPGDVIVRAQRDSITSVESLERAVGARGHTVLMVYRKGTPFQVVLHAPYDGAR